MKKIIGIGVLIGLVAVAMFFLKPSSKQPIVGAGGGSGVQFWYSSATQATSTVGTTDWTTVLSQNSGRGYAIICNNSQIANDAMFLGMGATTTKPYGLRLASGNCYEMTPDKMFYGAVYAVASTSSSTIMSVSASY